MESTDSNHHETSKITFFDDQTSLKYRHNINSPNARYEYHINDDYEIFYFISGCANYYIEGRVYSLKPGDVFILNNRETHRLLSESKTPIEIVVIHFSSRGFEFMGNKYHKLFKCFEDRKIGHDNLVSGGVDQVSDMSSYIKEIDDCIIEDNKYADVYIWSVFLKMLVTINLLYEQKSKKLKTKESNTNTKVGQLVKTIF